MYLALYRCLYDTETNCGLCYNSHANATCYSPLNSPTFHYYYLADFPLKRFLFISSLSKQNHRYIYDDRNPDVIFIPADRNKPFIKILKMRWRFGWKPVLVSVCGEAYKPFINSGMDFSFSYFPNRGKNCLSPSYSFQYLLEGKQNGNIRKWLKTPKTRFCNFVYSNTTKKATYVRRNFCRLLAKNKKVDCIGKSLFNMPEYKPDYSTCEATSSFLKPHKPHLEKLNFLAHYKFTIAFENKSQENYITEKIYHAFMAGSIPIYWGSPNIAEYFNPAAFINCHHYRTFDDVVARVKEIDNNPTLYKEHLTAPVLLPDSRLHTIMRDNVRHYDRIIKEILTRRGKRGYLLLHKLRTILFAIRHFRQTAAHLHIPANKLMKLFRLAQIKLRKAATR